MVPVMKAMLLASMGVVVLFCCSGATATDLPQVQHRKLLQNQCWRNGRWRNCNNRDNDSSQTQLALRQQYAQQATQGAIQDAASGTGDTQRATRVGSVTANSVSSLPRYSYQNPYWFG